MEQNRRNFIAGLGALAFAPALLPRELKGTTLDPEFDVEKLDKISVLDMINSAFTERRETRGRLTTFWTGWKLSWSDTLLHAQYCVWVPPGYDKDGLHGVLGRTGMDLRGQTTAHALSYDNTARAVDAKDWNLLARLCAESKAEARREAFAHAQQRWPELFA